MAKRGPKVRIDFSGADWEKNNTCIARALGCSREIVRLTRIRLGKPESKERGWYPKRDIEGEAKAAGLDISCTTIKEIAKTLGISGMTAWEHFRGRALHKYPMRKWDWSKVDLRAMTDREIMGIVGCSRMCVVNRRMQRGIYRRGPGKRYDWSKLGKKLFTLPIKEVVKLVGCSYPAVQVRRKIERQKANG